MNRDQGSRPFFGPFRTYRSTLPQLVHHNQTVHTVGSPGTYSFESQSDEKFKLSQGKIQSVNKIGNSEIYRLNHTPEKLIDAQEESQLPEISGSSGFCELSCSAELTNQVQSEIILK